MFPDHGFANVSTKALNPRVYDLQPSPRIFPLQTAEISDLCLNSSRAYTFDRCMPISGMAIDAIASRKATDVWVHPPGLNTPPFAHICASCKASINAPS